MNYALRRATHQKVVTKLALESMDKQAYVVVAAIVSQTGCRERSVTSVLENLAEQHEWEKRRDRETRSLLYSPKANIMPNGRRHPEDAEASSLTEWVQSKTKTQDRNPISVLVAGLSLDFYSSLRTL